jgi:hypothetical protein
MRDGEGGDGGKVGETRKTYSVAASDEGAEELARLHEGRGGDGPGVGAQVDDEVAFLDHGIIILWRRGEADAN